MLKAQTGTSIKSDVKLAGQEAARAVKEVKDAKMAFVYSGVQYDQKALLEAIGEELPGVPLVGNTSFTGVITQDGFVSGEDGFVGILALGGEDLTVGVAGLKKEGTARETGKKVAELALKKAGKECAPDYFYMVAPPGEEEFYLKGISEVIGRVPFFGGSAADNAIAGEWLLFTDEMITADGVAVAFFYTDKGFANEYTGAYEESEHVGIITKVIDNRVLAEIDGVPALTKYQEWTGTTDEEVAGGNLLAYSITAPLGVKDPLGDLIAIRHPMNGNEDKTISVGNNLAENTAIILMKGSVDGLIASTGKAVEKVTEKLGGVPAAYHLVHCGGRRAGIDARIDEVAAKLKKAAGDVPFICEFTFGEYGFEDDSKNTCGGLMLSFSAFEK
ncbi:MAG: FIST signal transduction protein [Anaerovoracaceae bacterium]